jgi:hypothetical protein
VNQSQPDFVLMSEGMKFMVRCTVDIDNESVSVVGEKDSQMSITRRSTVVIADAGTSAELLLFSTDKRIRPGATFRHRGATWLVTERRRDSGILVAEPITS